MSKIAGILLSAVLSSNLALGADVDSIFIPSKNVVLIPHLVVGGDVYVATLKRTSTVNFDFSLETATLTKVTPQSSDDFAEASDLLGTFSPSDQVGQVTMTFTAQNTWSLQHKGETDCSAGSESGTYQYEPKTGVMVINKTAGGVTCGLSQYNFVRFRENSSGIILVLPKENVPLVK